MEKSEESVQKLQPTYSLESFKQARPEGNKICVFSADRKRQIEEPIQGCVFSFLFRYHIDFRSMKIKICMA